MKLGGIRTLLIKTKAWTIEEEHVESISWSDAEATAIVNNEIIDLCEGNDSVVVTGQTITTTRYNRDTDEDEQATLKANPNANFPTLHRYGDNPALIALYDLHERLYVLEREFEECRELNDELRQNDIDALITDAHNIIHKFESGNIELNPTLATMKNLMVRKLAVLIEGADCLAK